MDFQAEEKLCQLAHEVWLQVAAEPNGAADCGGRADGTGDAGRDVLAALQLRDVFALEIVDAGF